MKNMKMTAEEAKEYSGTPSPGNVPAYPYGLTVCLNDDSLAKLGMTMPPAVGTKMMLMAMVECTSTSQSQQQDGDAESRCELQITDMELADAAKPDPASVMFGSMKS